MKRWLPALVGALLATSPALAGFTVPPNRPGAYAPRNECLRAPGAQDFAQRLRSAIARRDTLALAGLAAPDITLDFGGGAGRAELGRRLAGKDGEQLWRELEAASSLGCALQQGDLVFPWFFAQDLGDVDPFGALLATGRAVPLYRRNSARERPLAFLNWQLVIPQGSGIEDGAGQRPLRQASVINSPLAGYIPSGLLRSQVDYRLIVSRRGKAWQISAFVAGD